MKAIAIVELPDDAFDKGRWYLDKIYYTEKESLFNDYANEMWELKPLPKKEEGIGKEPLNIDDALNEGYVSGWNDCLDVVELGIKPLWEKQNES